MYSLYSLYALKEHYAIIIYTNKASYLKQYAPSSLNITYREVSQQEIENWKGPFNFVHRFKIKMLLDVIKHLEGSHAILYLDADTTIRCSLLHTFQEIEKGILWMHTNEGSITKNKKNKIFLKTTRYIQSNQTYSNKIPMVQNMWNAGALGFQSTDKHLLEKVLELTDQIYSEFSKHIVEQLAFSIVFSDQPNRALKALDNEIFHYWNFKEFRNTLKGFFNINQEEAAIKKEYLKIDPEELIKVKYAFEAAPFFTKQFNKFTGKWKKKIAYQHIRVCQKD